MLIKVFTLMKNMNSASFNRRCLVFLPGLFPVCFLSTSVPPMELRPSQSVSCTKVYRFYIIMITLVNNYLFRKISTNDYYIVLRYMYDTA